MSFDIYAKPDLSKKVRYNRKVREDEVEWEEREVQIYESADEIGHDHTDIQSHEGGRHTEEHPEAVQRRPFTAVVVCLAALCCLMLTGIIILFIHSTLKKRQLQKTISDMTVNNSQLKSSHETLQKNHTQLKSSHETLQKNHTQLKSSHETLQKNHTQLKSSHETLRRNYSQLQDEIKQLKSKTAEKCCPEGWTRFGCSCYFKSNEKKTWDKSRRDCQDKGADLVVINNKQEQKFLTELKVNGEFWIGLKTTKQKWNRGRWVWEWEWVDGSPLTEIFTESGLPQYSVYWSTAVYCDQQGRWKQSWNYNLKKWICEK